MSKHYTMIQWPKTSNTDFRAGKLEGQLKDWRKKYDLQVSCVGIKTGDRFWDKVSEHVKHHLSDE